jgi:hypothetical protein
MFEPSVVRFILELGGNMFTLLVNRAALGVLVVILGIAGYAGCERHTESPSKPTIQEQVDLIMPFDRLTGEAAVIAVYSRNSGIVPGRSSDPQLVCVVFRGGEIVYSRNPIDGGPPYFKRRANATDVETILRKANAIVIQNPPHEAYTGPDMNTTAIIIKSDGGRWTTLESCHELYEQRGKSVCSQDGLIPLQGKTEQSVKNTWTPKYRQFRQAWTEIRELLLPYTTDGNSVGTDSGIVWR